MLPDAAPVIQSAMTAKPNRTPVASTGSSGPGRPAPAHRQGDRATGGYETRRTGQRCDGRGPIPTARPLLDRLADRPAQVINDPRRLDRPLRQDQQIPVDHTRLRQRLRCRHRPGHRAAQVQRRRLLTVKLHPTHPRQLTKKCAHLLPAGLFGDRSA